MTNQIPCNGIIGQEQPILRSARSVQSNFNDPTRGDSLLSLLDSSRKANRQSSQSSSQDINAFMESSLSSLPVLDDLVPQKKDFISRAEWMHAVLEASLADIDFSESSM